ncbi:hypothetical protein COW64_21475 [bacterium (Candidatus Blackallbacteria) CG18_big_fil_WC_8_21_14_2_50_49_26]|nr:MAG: hypothetical protein COW64_21475 [bacterium (Candidatus Blackallbacteria) CG18_big_fil_WC_8_21_14_2_50_49_26]
MQRLVLFSVLMGLILNLSAPVQAETAQSAEQTSLKPVSEAAAQVDLEGDNGADLENEDDEDEDDEDEDDDDEDSHEEHHHGHSKPTKRGFYEGTPNLFSPVAVNADSLHLIYSHNFFSASFPRSSNPAFWLKYSPLDRLQIDGLVALRETPAEGELGLAYQIFSEKSGDWLNLMPRVAYNTRGNLFGVELAANKFLVDDIWQVGLDARYLSTAKSDSFDRSLAAVGFNTMVRVWKDWHLFGDVVVPIDSEILQKRSVLWSTGIKKVLGGTPHVLTLYAGNTQEQSLSGRTISSSNLLSDVFRVGFVFSIDIEHLSELPARLF